MKPIDLYPYQQKFVDALRPALVKHKRIIAVCPTGGGKTKMFLSITRMATAKERTVLIITESKKIFKQIRDEQHGRLIAQGSDNLLIRKGQVYIAMAQTLCRRQSMVDNFSFLKENLLIIFDECHIGTATGILRQLSDAYLIGFSATPDAKSAKHLPELYNHVVIGPQPQELIDLGYLMPYRHFARVGIDVDQLQIQKGEFTEASQEKVFETRVVYDGLIDDLRTMTYYKAGIYCASIKHCDTLHQELTNAGFECTKYYSGLPDSNLDCFVKGDVNICVSVGTLTRGWDFGPIDLIVFQRKTNSLPLFCQIIGRGSRRSPETGKTHFTVLDYGENYKQHGLWNADRDWEELAKAPKKKKKDSVAPIKVCVACESIVPASARVCSFCGHVFEKNEPENPPESKLIEVTALYETMRGRKVSQLKPEELAIYAKLKNKKVYAIRVAKAQEQANAGWLKEFGKHMGYKPAWYYMQSRDLHHERIQYHDIILN